MFILCDGRIRPQEIAQGIQEGNMPPLCIRPHNHLSDAVDRNSHAMERSLTTRRWVKSSSSREINVPRSPPSSSKMGLRNRLSRFTVSKLDLHRTRTGDRTRRISGGIFHYFISSLHLLIISVAYGCLVFAFNHDSRLISFLTFSSVYVLISVTFCI